MNRLKRFLLRSLLYLTVIFLSLTIVAVLPFRWLNPPVTMVMLEKYFTSEQTDYSIQYEWVDWNDMPPTIVMAVITSEDQRFLQHSGIDIEAIFTAIEGKLNGKPLRGASTITQQVAKNMYLWTGRSWVRKGLELWFSAFIELLWSKQRIMEVYLNIAELGHGIFGVGKASQYYFSHSVQLMTPKQAALLASTLPSPLRYNPAQPSVYLRDRAEWNLEQQKKLGGLTWLSILYKE
jgi:monofunctional biosynthetic peptidoglycan transglycosylase